MKRSRFSEEQIIATLKQGEAGSKTAELCRKHGICEQLMPTAIPSKEMVSALLACAVVSHWGIVTCQGNDLLLEGDRTIPPSCLLQELAQVRKQEESQHEIPANLEQAMQFDFSHNVCL